MDAGDQTAAAAIWLCAAPRRACAHALGLSPSRAPGTWERDWYGECPTADLVYTLASACPYPAGDQGDADCAADPSCVLTPSRPTEYGRCRLKDDLLWDAIFGAVGTGVTHGELGDWACRVQQRCGCGVAGSGSVGGRCVCLLRYVALAAVVR